MTDNPTSGNPFVDWVMPPQPLPGDPQERVGDSDFPPDYFRPEGESQPEPTIAKELASYKSVPTPPVTDLRSSILRNLVDYLDIRLKHQAGRHNQKRHGWRYGIKPGAASVGGAAGLERARLITEGPTHRFHDEAKRIVAASISLRRTPEAGEHIEYRKRAGLVSPPPNIHYKPTTAVAAPKRVPKPKPAAPPPKPPEPEVDLTKPNIPYRAPKETQKEIYEAIDHQLTHDFGIARSDVPATRLALEKELQTIVDRSPLVIRAPLAAAKSIVKDGRWKTQFESGTTRGSYTPSGRSTAEKNGLGVPTTIDPAKRPVYGYLEGATRDGATTEAYSYGEVKFYMKPATRTRATFTHGDSLGTMGSGTQIGTPVVRSNLGSLGRSGYRTALTSTGGTVHVDRSSVNYFEAQIHSGVTLADVSRVHFSRDCFNKDYDAGVYTLKPAYKTLEKQLKTKGIEVTYYGSTEEY